MSSLKTFIKSVRSSKTLADERSIIKRESALIRTAFKDVHLSHQSRRINIQKLLYLYILGEQTHFGQIESIKLLASSNFIDKRLGYLATMLILDENQQILTLLTNSLNNDMNHPNQFVVALALTTLGNIASPELARDLYTDVEKIATGNNNYLKKKALMVASKIVEKDPDLSEVFIEFIAPALISTYHGALLGTLKLIRSIYQNSPELRSQLLKNIPKLFDILKDLISSGSTPEYDAMGITDPFLQISLVKTLNLLFTDEEHLAETSPYLEKLNDALTTIVSYTTFSKNSGAAVLNQAVRTIFNIPNIDPALKVLGINTLGQLLSTKENNNRYVALNTLLSVVSIEPLAVQRHRQTIVACLTDNDISIKRRALELSFAILDSSNIRILVKEILNFLENPANNDRDLKIFIIDNVINILERNELIPNQKWKFDTLIRFIKLSGDSLNSNNISQILALIMNIPNNDELKTYTINKIFQIGLNDQSKEGLNLINIYLVGEYGDLLINTKKYAEAEDTTSIKENDLVQYLLNLASLQNENTSLISYLLTSSLKLSTKISTQSQRTLLKNFILSKTNSIDLNIQIKAVSYSVLFNEPEKIKSGILDRIPPPPIKAKETTSLTNKKSIKNSLIQSSVPSGHRVNTPSSKTEDLLLDLMGDDILPSNGNQQDVNNADLLQDIFGAKSSTSHQSSAKNDILNLFDSPVSQQQQQQQPQQQSSSIQSIPSNAIEAYVNANIRVFFAAKSIGNEEAIIETIISNLSSQRISNISLLIAVPRSQKLTMSSMTSNFINSNEDIHQDLKIVGTQGGKIKLRVKVGYELNGLKQDEQFDFGAFGQTL